MRPQILSSLAAVAAISSLAFGAAHAQTRPGSTSAQASASAARGVDEATILAQEDGWAVALIKRDRAFFDRMLAPGFVYTEDNRLMSRANVLTDATTGSDHVTAAHNEQMVVHPFGSTAVVTGLLITAGSGPGGKFERRYRFTDTWVKQPAGSWRIVAAQDYLIPAKPR